MSSEIHPTALVADGARIGKNVAVGPYAVVEDNVLIDDGTSIGSHAVVGWGTRLGRNCKIFNGASVGTIPQDLKFVGEESVLEIGDNTIVREFCTLNRGTKAAGKTVVGSNCALLAYCHVAHDCILGNGVVASNNLALGGHVEIGNNVVFGAYTTVHQFSRIGAHAFIQANTRVLRDIIPFAIVGCDQARTRIAGINKVGLERRGFDEQRRAEIKRAFRLLFRKGLTIEQALPVLSDEFSGNDDVALIIDFVRKSQRGIYNMQG